MHFQVDSDGQENHFEGRRNEFELEQKPFEVEISESRFEHQRDKPLGNVQQQRDSPNSEEPERIRNQFDAGHALREDKSGRGDGLQDQGSLPQSGRLSIGRSDVAKRIYDVTERTFFAILWRTVIDFGVRLDIIQMLKHLPQIIV